MLLKGADKKSGSSLKSPGVPSPDLVLFCWLSIWNAGYCQPLPFLPSWFSRERYALTVSPHPPRHPNLLALWTCLQYVLASDRNLELSGLGINCLTACVQIASLTSYLKCLLKYTGALCKLLYKLWSPLLLLTAASVALTLSNVSLAPGQGSALQTLVSRKVAHQSH